MSEPEGQPRLQTQHPAIRPARRARSAPGRHRRSWPVIALRAFGMLLAVALFVAWWSFLRIVELPSWPPPADAIKPEQAQAMTEAFAARERPRVDDIAIPYAPTTASSVDLYSEGTSFFPA